MTLFQTPADQKVQIYEVAAKMKNAGLPNSFIAAAVERACGSEGIADLLHLWRDESDPLERDEIIADIQEAIDEAAEQTGHVVERPKIRYTSLQSVSQRILAYKNELRLKVDRWGGISKLAEATGMPQPSLSRFFSKASMPRRTTLFKIAKALDLSEEEIVFDWVA
jgi:helix-turn-helix protein